MSRTGKAVSRSAFARETLCRVFSASAAACLLLSCSEAATPGDTASGMASAALGQSMPSESWRAMIASEEVIHALGPALSGLSRSVENLRLPDPGTRSHFAVTVAVTDLAPRGFEAPSEALPGVPAFRRRLVPGPTQPRRAPMDVDLWRPLLDRVERFEHARFAVREGRFADGETERFETLLEISGTAKLRSGALGALTGTVRVVWLRDPGSAEEATWRIDGWHTGEFDWLETERPFFREVLGAALGDPMALARAQHSEHERLALRMLLAPEGFVPPHEYFFLGSQDRHPALSIVDVNGDGLDDVYVMARWGPNQLYVNRGDGHFDERAAAWGLDLSDHSAAALFADFDNDGDPDVFIGRTLAASRYLEHTGARYEDRTDRIEGRLPSLVSSLAAADYDGDGLLDLYVSTYAAQMIVAERVAIEKELRESDRAPSGRLLASMLAPEDAERLWQESGSREAHLYMALPGPPNALLTNLGGGRFRVEAGAGPLEVLRAFRNTYQATWGDYDNDGDPDLYLAHDFAPNQMLRNDGGVFADVTELTGTADIGFGMGASWGDYDGDGRQDLYVSNMYSKAGRRITARFDGIDARLRKMARGNTLFRNTGERFERVSGAGPADQQVEVAGWSWGGQFADWNNDGHLDLHALSGYYTSPLQIESAVDI